MKTGEGGEVCRTCDWWERNPMDLAANPEGRCKAGPPVVAMVKAGNRVGPVATWPPVRADEGACGAHSAFRSQERLELPVVTGAPR